MSDVFKTKIEPLLDISLKKFVERIRNDKIYLSVNHNEPWKSTVLKICILLRRIIYEIYKAKPNYVHFFTFGLGIKEESIENIICLIEFKLNNNFNESPPFTIYPFVKTLFFIEYCNDYLPVSETDICINSGLRKYKRTTKDLVMGTQLDVEVYNRYHKSITKNKDKYNDEDIETEADIENEDINELENNNSNNKDNTSSQPIFKNDVKAIKYLRSLIDLLSVESNVDEVTDDLIQFGSKNIIRNNNTHKGYKNHPNISYEEDTVSDSSVNSIKMVKIPWYDPSMLTLMVDHSDNNSNDNGNSPI
jgi:hypothetical protein